MDAVYSIENHTVHLWRVLLTDYFAQERELLPLLNPEELQRANRFHFPHHRQRFIIARSMLRKILSVYTNIAPQEIVFDYGPRGKPYLRDNHHNLQFNLSHSQDFAVYALMLNDEIGVDIEKMSDKYNEGVAQRFFSVRENADLNQLPAQDRIAGFYQLWAYKEALIKAVGEGLYVPLDEFSVDLHKPDQFITLTHEQRTASFYLESFATHPDYRSALATSHKVERIIYQQSLAI